MALIKINIAILLCCFLSIQAVEKSNSLSEITIAHKKSLLVLEKKYIEHQINKQQLYLKKLEDYKLGVMQAGNLTRANEVQRVIDTSKSHLKTLVVSLNSLGKPNISKATDFKPSPKSFEVSFVGDWTSESWPGLILTVSEKNGKYTLYHPKINRNTGGSKVIGDKLVMEWDKEVIVLQKENNAFTYTQYPEAYTGKLPEGKPGRWNSVKLEKRSVSKK